MLQICCILCVIWSLFLNNFKRSAADFECRSVFLYPWEIILSNIRCLNDLIVVISVWKSMCFLSVSLPDCSGMLYILFLDSSTVAISSECLRWQIECLIFCVGFSAMSNLDCRHTSNLIGVCFSLYPVVIDIDYLGSMVRQLWLLPCCLFMSSIMSLNSQSVSRSTTFDMLVLRCLHVVLPFFLHYVSQTFFPRRTENKSSTFQTGQQWQANILFFSGPPLPTICHAIFMSHVTLTIKGIILPSHHLQVRLHWPSGWGACRMNITHLSLRP